MSTSNGRAGFSASSLSFKAAVLIALIGMAWGIHMAVSQNHAALPAHAHLNLLGWVSLFLFGIFYHLHPALDRTRFAVAQVVLWIVGTIVMVIGVALLHAGNTAGDPLAGIGSILSVAAMLMFAWTVFRRRATAMELSATTAAAPAE